MRDDQNNFKMISFYCTAIHSHHNSAALLLMIMSDASNSSSENSVQRGRRRERMTYQRTTSADKKRLLTCARNGGDWKTTAETLQINYHTAYRIVRADYSPVRRPGGSRRKLSEEHELALCVMVDENPSITR